MVMHVWLNDYPKEQAAHSFWAYLIDAVRQLGKSGNKVTPNRDFIVSIGCE